MKMIFSKNGLQEEEEYTCGLFRSASGRSNHDPSAQTQRLTGCGTVEENPAIEAFSLIGGSIRTAGQHQRAASSARWRTVCV